MTTRCAYENAACKIAKAASAYPRPIAGRVADVVTELNRTSQLVWIGGSEHNYSRRRTVGYTEVQPCSILR